MTQTPADNGTVPRAVVVRLRGGIGNQMFEYAVGRCVAEKHGRELFLDDLALREDPPGATKRLYSLDAFQIQAHLTSQKRIAIGEEVPVLAQVVECRRGFHEVILAPSPYPCIYLQGFWQDERYFLEIQDLLRQEFRFRPGLWQESPWQSRITAEQSPVCVHVRRQDYLAKPGQRLGFIGKEYYDQAARLMAGKVGNAHFFVFSDDLPWCEENLTFSQPYSFVRHPGPPADHTVTDLRLMAMCRHFVIANSSFSWWAAWLGTDAEKVVIAPQRWYQISERDSKYITPPNWLRL